MDPEKPQILVVEDESNVGSTLTERFNQEGYEVRWARSVQDSQNASDTQRFDLALIDVGLPDGSGFELARLLKDRQPSMKILFLTAFSNPEDRIQGLELGAEDYIVKPFHYKELRLRVHNILKRSHPSLNSIPDTIQIGKARIDFNQYEIQTHEQSRKLTPKEWHVLKLLVERKGQVVRRDELLEKAWPQDEFPSTRTIDNFIMRLRRVIEPDPDSPNIIENIRGVGYQLNSTEDDS